MIKQEAPEAPYGVRCDMGRRRQYLLLALAHARERSSNIITDPMRNGMVYAEWSAGAVIAGPTLDHIELMEDTDGLADT